MEHQPPVASAVAALVLRQPVPRDWSEAAVAAVAAV
jgi:hypothetical protein